MCCLLCTPFNAHPKVSLYQSRSALDLWSYLVFHFLVCLCLASTPPAVFIGLPSLSAPACPHNKHLLGVSRVGMGVWCPPCEIGFCISYSKLFTWKCQCSWVSRVFYLPLGITSFLLDVPSSMGKQTIELSSFLHDGSTVVTPCAACICCHPLCCMHLLSPPLLHASVVTPCAACICCQSPPVLHVSVVTGLVVPFFFRGNGLKFPIGITLQMGYPSLCLACCFLDSA